MVNVVFYDVVAQEKVIDAQLPEVPRIGDQIISDNTLYGVEDVTWDLLREQVLINLR